MSSARATPESNRKKRTALLVGIAVALVLLVGIAAFALSSGGDGADPQGSPNAPADTLKDTPQNDKLGGDTGGGE